MEGERQREREDLFLFGAIETGSPKAHDYNHQTINETLHRILQRAGVICHVLVDLRHDQMSEVVPGMPWLGTQQTTQTEGSFLYSMVYYSILV